jgi:hypothetical protein
MLLDQRLELVAQLHREPPERPFDREQDVASVIRLGAKGPFITPDGDGQEIATALEVPAVLARLVGEPAVSPVSA